MTSEFQPCELVKILKKTFICPRLLFIAQVLVGPSKQVKQIFQVEHNAIKNPN